MDFLELYKRIREEQKQVTILLRNCAGKKIYAVKNGKDVVFWSENIQDISSFVFEGNLPQMKSHRLILDLRKSEAVTQKEDINPFNLLESLGYSIVSDPQMSGSCESLVLHSVSDENGNLHFAVDKVLHPLPEYITLVDEQI